MPLYLLMECEVPKDKALVEDYWKVIEEKGMPLLEKMQKEKGFKSINMADNAGHQLWLWEFEDTDAFSKLWNSKEYHSFCANIQFAVTDMKIRILRPSMLR